MTQLLEYYARAADANRDEVLAFVGRVIPLVLIDVSISDTDDRFELGQFTQEMPGAPREAWQVPYDEALLSLDGTTVLARWAGCAKSLADARIAFYFHYYDPVQPVQWSYGELSCPTPQPVGERLLALVPYNSV